MQVTVWSYTTFKGLGPFAAQALRSLGYRASVKLLAGSYFTSVADSRNRPQIGFEFWGADYPAASDCPQHAVRLRRVPAEQRYQPELRRVL